MESVTEFWTINQTYDQWFIDLELSIILFLILRIDIVGGIISFDSLHFSDRIVLSLRNGFLISNYLKQGNIPKNNA